MSFPRIIVAVDSDDNVCISRQLRSDDEPLTLLSLSVEGIKEMPPEEAVKRMGITVLGMLQVLDKDSFGNWKLPTT
jgi:hypothetical protein